MLTYGATRGCGLTSWVVCINDKFCDIKERNVTIRSEIWATHICSPRVLGYYIVSDIVEVDITRFRVNCRGGCSWSAPRRQRIGYHNAMKYVLVLSEEEWVVMANSRYWEYVWTNFWLQKIIVISIRGIQLPKSLQSSLFLSFCTGNICTALYVSKSSRESLKWSVMGASTLAAYRPPPPPPPLHPLLQGEPAATYKWTGWVSEITGSSRRLEITIDHFRDIYGISYTPIYERRSQKMPQHVRATSDMSQEPWPWNCESPKESTRRPSNTPPTLCSVVTDPQV